MGQGILVEDGEFTPFGVYPLFPPESADGFVDADTGGAGHLGQVGLGEGQVNNDTVGGDTAVLFGQIEQCPRQPGRQIKEENIAQLAV